MCNKVIMFHMLGSGSKQVALNSLCCRADTACICSRGSLATDPFFFKACSTIISSDSDSCNQIYISGPSFQLFKADFKNKPFHLISIAALILSMFFSKCVQHAKPFLLSSMFYKGSLSQQHCFFSKVLFSHYEGKTLFF